MLVASKTLYETVSEMYESNWTGCDEVSSAVQVGGGLGGGWGGQGGWDVLLRWVNRWFHNATKRG